MCGIIGFVGKNVTKEHIRTLQKVMIESRIRGMHASGVAWCTGKTLQSYVKSIPIDELVEEIDWNKLVIDGKLSMIAHARYSTSDIKYNQPIVGKHLAVAHNGVITQSSPDSWYENFGYKCTTSNDSELLLKSLENNDNPLEKFEGSSIAAVVLNDKGELIAMRNSIRPLWQGKIGNGIVYASTYDILNRADVKDITKVKSLDHKELQRRNLSRCPIIKI